MPHIGMDPAKDIAAPYSVHAIHLVRTAQQINVSLSQMADQKASILMGATFVVFTISIGQAKGGGLTLPLALLALSSFLSAVLAVMAIIPAVKAPPVADANLLFFGSFTQLPEDQFVSRVLDRLREDETVFSTMLQDIYQNGRVLQRKKYRFLGYAYRVFLLGLGLTLLAFVAEHIPGLT